METIIPNALLFNRITPTSKRKTSPLKDVSKNGFVFYTNLDSKKSNDLKNNPNASMCFHWNTLLRQIRIVGNINLVNSSEADKYYESRAYGSRIGAWASKQSTILNTREDLYRG